MSNANRSRLALLFIGLGCIGLISRFLLAALSIGCDDADIWLGHARTLDQHGMRHAFETQVVGAWHYNHPPLLGYWAVLSGHMSNFDPEGFSHWMKAPGLIAEVLTALLVYHIWNQRNPDRAALAFAAYGLSLPLILVSGYHCNTECVYAGLALLAVYLMHDKRSPFLSGLALAAALNVKLLPIFLGPPLLSQCRSRRELVRFAAGAALAVVPFVPFLITSASGMYRNMLAYNSLQVDWGIMAFLNHAVITPPFGGELVKLREFAISSGRYWILGSVVAVSVLAGLRRSRAAYELGAMAWALFLVLTPGFGVQYTVSVLPLLFVADLGRAALYSMTVGLMLFVIYTFNMPLRFPLHALVQYRPIPTVATLCGVLAWFTLLSFVVFALPKIVSADTRSSAI